MNHVLITGATGFVGSRLARHLSTTHKVITLSRGRSTGPWIAVQGDFGSEADLAQLDTYQLDAVVHLAAETGGTTEEAGLAVNVLGTRRLLRYLADRGVRRFVVASSIAASGCLSPEFLPRRLPIPADHPCDAHDAYGLSKALMEEVCVYFQRLDPELAMTVLRLGVVVPESTSPVAPESLGGIDLPFTSLATVAVQDVVAIIARALEFEPGFHRFNAVAPWLPTPLSVRDALDATLGARGNGLDLSGYEESGPTSFYETAELVRATGYPQVDVRSTTPA
ncbi:UDP-glucose 4-epimerase [Kribbella orskensis]|uniref:UDP-glucose 4-epimerase n=1 Tax=Kribbella orskensis TaxID=2512216 RepID=A0ABY2BQM2_9ACTN|nr:MULTISPECIES: NAD(P)-dependent oxidoreductase [Kribbella]TCN37312.1 UDP-glucose 4-epimerase [Kribbella sp. VKM Ac-2500]TCO27780.1 UDP-glucose 4-epimerase [Kribbella orskensis]